MGFQLDIRTFQARGDTYKAGCEDGVLISLVRKRAGGNYFVPANRPEDRDAWMHFVNELKPGERPRPRPQRKL